MLCHTISISANLNLEDSIMNNTEQQFNEFSLELFLEQLTTVNVQSIEQELEGRLEQQLNDYGKLCYDKSQVDNPQNLGQAIADVVWEQFINQIGVTAGEDFIKENRGLKLDLSDDAHIQTADNFKEGKIAKHNYKSREQLEHNYDRYKNKPHGEYRKEYVNPGMDAAMPRAGALNSQGVNTVTDIYTGRQIPTQTKLENGKQNPLSAQREHVDSSANLYNDPSLQMANGDQKLADIINDPHNLQGYTTAERNNRKSDCSPEDMEERDKNKHWENANKKAEDFIEGKKKEGEERLKKEGCQTRKEEALRIGEEALKAVLMTLLSNLVKEIITKLIKWFKSGAKTIEAFLESLKESVFSFIDKLIDNLKQYLENATDSLLTTIATALLGPIVGFIKKAWILIKQGGKSVKDAYLYLTDPNNKEIPFDLLLLNAGKILIAGLTASGAIVLGEVISKSLSTIPFFAFQILKLGSLGDILGIFLGAVACGIIGAIALHMIDKAIAKRTIENMTIQQIQKSDEILIVQERLRIIAEYKLCQTRESFIQQVTSRHQHAAQVAADMMSTLDKNHELLANI